MEGLELNVRISDVNHQGKGIARYNNKVIFINNACVDELVKIRIIKENKKFLEAEVLEIIEESNDRVKPLCPYYKECGGCDIMHFSYSKQLLFKMNKVKNIFNKYLKQEINIKEIYYDKQYNYRNKVTFHVKENIGFYKEKTYELIKIDECLLCSSYINDLIKILSKLDLNNIKSIVIRNSFDNNKLMVVFDVIGSINEKLIIEKLKNYVNSIYIKDNNYTLIYGDKYIIDKIGELSFVISPDSFFQVNTNMAYRLYSKVLEYSDCSNKKVLDLYCGTGTIGLFLASKCKQLVGVEINKYAINDANVNKEINKFENVRFICGDSGKVLKKLNYKPDVIVVDPPRSGLDTLAINQIISLNAKRVIYVSCDPITLARDLNILKEYYNILEVSLVDMFPNTHHVESVCLLECK